MQRYGDDSKFLYRYSLTIYQFRRICYLCKAMKKILKVDNPNVYAEYVGAPVLHTQLALISYDEVSPFRSSLNNYGVYGLFIQQQFPKSNDIIDIFKDFTFTRGIEFISFRFFIIVTSVKFFGGS